jgi:hypothetical protein
MFASVLQALGLAITIAAGFVLGIGQGAVAVGLSFVYVGLAMERDS